MILILDPNRISQVNVHKQAKEDRIEDVATDGTDREKDERDELGVDGNKRPSYRDG